MARRAPTLWHCPRCGAAFVNKNQWHSCGVFALEEFFGGKPRARVLFDGFLKRLRASVGDFQVIPQKTRITFLAKTRFAGIARATQDSLVVSIGLPRRAKHPTIERVEHIQRWFVHYARIRHTKDVDAPLLALLRESYHEMGLRNYLHGGEAATRKR